jgi:hypothetical protein
MSATSDLFLRPLNLPVVELGILQGMDDVFVCRCHHDQEEIQDGELVPFPSMFKGVCPVVQCFAARVFTDVETLRSQIYADLN